MNYELQFLIMVNCDFELDRLLNQIRSEWQDINWVKQSSFDISRNWVQISKNEDFDPAYINNPDDGYLYYRFRVEVSPIKKIEDVKQQVDLAKTLKSRFDNMGCMAEICADFEELLLDNK